MTVAVSLKPGPLFHLRKVDIQGALPAKARAQLGLAPGAPARAQDVLAAQTRLLDTLRAEGYALAKVSTPAVIEDPAADSLDVTYTVTTGPRVDFGKISVKGLHSVNQAFVERRLLIHSGEQFSPQAVEKARADLASLGVFSSVRVTTSDKLDAEGRLPIEIDVVEGPAHAVTFGAAYSTDLGAGLTTTWSHRNLFGNAEQLNLSGGVAAGGTVEKGLAYNASAQFIKPDFLDRNQSLQADLGAVKQNLLAYNQQGVSADLLLKRTFLTHWSGSIGISGEVERIGQEGVTRDYSLVGLPIAVKYDSTNSLLDPTHGFRAAATATPTHSLGGTNATFVLMQLSGSTYLDLSYLWNNPGRSVIAVRGLAGTAEGASQFQLPPDQRSYAGGSSTVRGYEYQSVGPQFADGNPEGGTSVVAGSVEYRQRILSDYGFVAFLDGGQASRERLAFRRRPEARGRHRLALLYVVWAAAARFRRAADKDPQRRELRNLSRHRAGLLMRRVLKWIGWSVAILVAVPAMLVLVVLAGGNTAPGQALIARLAPRLTGGLVTIDRLSGRFPDRLRRRGN